MKNKAPVKLSKNVLIGICCGVAVLVASIAAIASRLADRRKRKAEEALLDEEQQAMAEGEWEESAE